MKKRIKKGPPTCVLCGRSERVSFDIFTPRIPPFGTACTECEAALPPGPVDLDALLKLRAKPAPTTCDCGGCGMTVYVAHGPGGTFYGYCSRCERKTDVAV